MKITILESTEITVQEPRKSWAIKNNIKTAVVRNMAHLLRAYELLNDYGKQVAVERLLELAQIPAYQSTDFSEETFKALAAEVARHPGRMQINGFHQPEENKSR